MSISYSLPQSLLSRVKVQEASIYVQGQNLLTYSDFYSLDPETGSGLPPLRMLTIGMQIKL